MKKTILGVIAIAVLLGFNIALAKDNPSGTPFNVIWEAITNLQTQINEIVLMPGLPGEDGQDGEDGEDGLNCWDLDGDGIKDPEEDLNGDSIVDVLDCKGDTGEQGEPGQDAQHGAGNIAFIYSEINPDRNDYWLLKIDGTVWHVDQNNFYPGGVDYQVPIPVSDIVDWQYNSLLDKDGNYWLRQHVGWLNMGPLP